MKKRIIFYQPALPEYRVSFFDNLKSIINLDLIIVSSKKDFLNVESVNYDGLIYAGPFKKLGPFFWQKKPNKIKMNKSDIVVISGNPRILNYMLILLICKLKKIKIIWWGQGWTAGRKSTASKIRRKIMLLADAIVVYTQKESLSINHRHVIGLNNGINIKKIPVFNKVNTFNDNIIKIFFIGRLTEKANLELLLNALVLVNRNFTLDIIGDGITHKKVKEIALSNKLNNNINWHGNIHDENYIYNIAKDCNVFIYPGSVGLSLIHAFALSLPAIVHDDENYHMPEYSAFQKGHNGLTFPRNNCRALADCINSLDVKELEIMSKNARKTVEESFNTDDMAVRFNQIIKVLCEKNIN